MNFEQDSLYSSMFSNKKLNFNTLNSAQALNKEFKSTLKKIDSRDSIHNVLGNNFQFGNSNNKLKEIVNGIASPEKNNLRIKKENNLR